jgi:hypothetical protein
VVGLDSGVQAIDGGDAETCAALGEGGARCWGLNLDGSLGDGGYETQALTPSRVIGLRGGASAVSRGFYYGCGLTTLGGAVCWGMNDYGQIGNGDGGGGHYTDSATEVVGFEGPKYVGVKRRGRGTVTSDPAAIDCGSACAHLFTHGTQVTLSATPDPGSVFLGWSGACSGTGTCSVVLDGDRVAVASFAGVSTSGSPNLTAPQRRLRLPFPGLVRSPPRCYCPARGG